MRPLPPHSLLLAHARLAPLSLPQHACAARPRRECAPSLSSVSHRSTSPAGPCAPAPPARLVCSQGAESPRSALRVGSVLLFPAPLFLLLPPNVAARGSVCACRVRVCACALGGAGGGRGPPCRGGGLPAPAGTAARPAPGQVNGAGGKSGARPGAARRGETSAGCAYSPRIWRGGEGRVYCAGVWARGEGKEAARPGPAE